MEIRVISNSGAIPTPNGKGKTYRKVELSYEANGKVQGKGFVDFADVAVFDKVLALKEGDYAQVKAKQEGKYWKWAELVPGRAEPTSFTPAPTSPSGDTVVLGKQQTGRVVGSNYETKEERAERQVLIVRQSCLSTAVEFAKAVSPTGTPIKSRQVIALAKEFEEYVFDKSYKVVTSKAPKDESLPD